MKDTNKPKRRFFDPIENEFLSGCIIPIVFWTAVLIGVYHIGYYRGKAAQRHQIEKLQSEKSK